MMFRLRKERDDLPRLALSLASLGAVGFSLVLCFQLLWMQLAIRTTYALSNVLGAPNRDLLLLTLALGIITLPLLAVLIDKRRPGTRFEVVHTSATVLAPLALLFVLPGLFLSQVAANKPLFYLVILSAFGLALRALLAASFAACARPLPARWRAWLEAPRFARLRGLRLPMGAWLLSVMGAAAGYAALLTKSALLRHHSLLSPQDELSSANNALANLLHGRGLRVPAHFGTLPGSYASLHADYAALLFAPLYALRPGADALLRLQVVLVALNVVPLFLLAAHLLGQRAAVWASFAFLLLAPLHVAVVYSFSWLPAFCLFSFTFYYAVLARRPWLLAFALPALLASSDAGPVAVFAFGVFLGTSSKRTRLALGLCLVSALIFGWNTRLALSAPGDPSPPVFAQALTTLTTNPTYFLWDLARAAKINVILQALAPLALLPLAWLRALPLILPGFAVTSATNEFWPTTEGAYPYAVVWIPGAFLSLLLTLQRLRSVPAQRPLYLASVVTITVTLLGHCWAVGTLLQRDGTGQGNAARTVEPAQAAEHRYAQLSVVLPSIPATGSVVATSYMLPYVSARADAFDARRSYPAPDYILLSSLELVGEARTALEATVARGQYQLLGHAGEFYAFQRGAETPQTSAALSTLGLSHAPAAVNPP